MNTYECLLIFQEQVTEEQVEPALTHLQGELEKLGGKVLGVDRLGRRQFARRLQKKTHGFYCRIRFTSDPQQIAGLNARYKLIDELFRFQIVAVPPKRAPRVERKKADEPASQAAPAGGG